VRDAEEPPSPWLAPVLGLICSACPPRTTFAHRQPGLLGRWQDKLLDFNVTLKPDEGYHKCVASWRAHEGESGRTQARWCSREGVEQRTWELIVACTHASRACTLTGGGTRRGGGGRRRGAAISFSFKVSGVYPHEAPKVKCLTKVYHPNIDMDGNVCLNILREDWKPVLSINSIIYGLQFLFLVAPRPRSRQLCLSNVGRTQSITLSLSHRARL
jgi:hypothetical protein